MNDNRNENPKKEWKGLVWLNAELKVLERKNDPVSRERYDELVDELITMDMAMGPIRRTMGRTAEKTHGQKAGRAR
jgi:hypothetical protein